MPSRLGLGGAPIGNLYTAVSDEDARAAVEAAWLGGVRYFDTAPHYGLGLSEHRLGDALSEMQRSEFVVSTKVGRTLVPNDAPVGMDSAGFAVPDVLKRVPDYSATGVRAGLEASMRRLRVEHVDIALVHDPEDHLDEAIESALPELARLRDQGTVAAIGAGMNLVEPLRRIVAETDLDVIMLAGRWTLLDRSGAELLTECAQRGVQVIAAAPFNSGLLASDAPAPGATFNYGPASAALLDQARELAAVCREHSVALPHAAIQFPLQHPAVACVVAGARTAAEATQAAAWAREPLPDSLWSDLEEACG